MTYTKTPGPLSILVSARVRITPEERTQLKQAYSELRSSFAPVQKPSANGSTIVVEERNYSTADLDARLGFDSYIFADIINSRDSISIPILLRIQRALGIEVLTPKRLMDAAQSYCDYVFSEDTNDNS
jgi:hypothetical protein